MRHCLIGEAWSPPATCFTSPQVLEEYALRLLGEAAGKPRERMNEHRSRRRTMLRRLSVTDNIT
ncbi:MAG: hypothetical protein ACK2UK_05725 [Candidatus Promineifilaceae bacterium]